MFIGGVAVGFHGFPRSTADIDFWYNPQVENFQKIINALNEYGIDTADLNALILDPQKIFLRVPQLGFRTEFLPQISGVKSFRESKKSAVKTQLDGVEVFVLGYDDLIKNKETVKHAIDLTDVEELRKRKKKSGD